jgi:folate-binding protein YgfZ
MDADAQANRLREGAGWRRLVDHRLLRISGDDAASWLQGQVTNDVLAIPPGGSAYGLVLEKTGRIASDAFVHRLEDSFLLVLPEARALAVLAHFDAHIIMEDVELALCPELTVLAVQGPGAAEAVAGDQRVFAADRLGTSDGVDVIMAAEDADGLEAELAARGLIPLDAEGWELARLRAAVPRMDVDFGERTLPQEAGLERRAVSFTKGCYLGQEPVVMLEHRGKPPKRLFVVRSEGPIERETPLTAADDDAVVGRVTSAASCPEPGGGYIGMALIKRAHAEPGTTLRAGATSVRLVEPVGATTPAGATDPT